MKQRLDPNPTFIIITVVLVSVIRFPTIWCQETGPYEVCNQTVVCGDIEFDYPFWGLGRPSYCGHPGFQLICRSNVSELVYENVEYRVLETPDASTHTITVARNDLWSNLCPRYLYNTTYDQAVLSSDNFGQQNVSMYYRCNSSLPRGPLFNSLNRFSCNINETASDGYFTRTDFIIDPEMLNYLGQCNNHIIVPVNRESAQRFTQGPVVESDLVSVLTAGFNLEWTANNNLCDQCIRSDGKCGSNLTSPYLFACYCANGNFSLTCNNTATVQGGESSSKSALIIVLPIVGAVIAGVGIVLAIFVCRQRRKRRAIKESSPAHTETKAILATVSGGLNSDSSKFTSSIPSYPSSKTSKTSNDYGNSSYFGAQVFTYEELEEATDNFNDSRELGDGGFGTVYYGKLFDGREVAVKRLYENNFKRVEQFMNEVAILTQLAHENLVKLYGCTSKRSRELLLVYEYIPNGTVADHLHGKLANSRSSLFSWSVRLNIAIQTAEALAYLHKKEIIHRDVKTNNILLDKSFRVKVADFGLSRLFPTDVTHVSTAPQGTPGYVDPEYYQCYQLTVKSDVYSFGVVLIELISSLQAVDTSRHRLDINLANMAMTKIQTHMLDELVDKSIGFETNGSVRRMITLVSELAFRCLQQERDMRPEMNEVVEILKGIQNEDLNAQKPEVLDIVVDDGGMFKDNNTKPPSPAYGVNNKLVHRSLQNSSDG